MECELTSWLHSSPFLRLSAGSGLTLCVLVAGALPGAVYPSSILTPPAESPSASLTLASPPSAPDGRGRAFELGSRVSTLTGSYLYAYRDLTSNPSAPGLEFVRSYSSGDPRQTAFGQGWTHNFTIRLRSQGDGSGDFILVGPQGQSYRYPRKADGTFSRPLEGVDITLAGNFIDGYRAAHGDGTRWDFDAIGNIRTITDPAGRQTMVTYDAADRVATVTDPLGRGALTLSYHAETSRLASVTDWLDPPRTVRYEYDFQGRLSDVIDREDNRTRFTYLGGTHRLATITDARGHTAISIVYDDQGRVIDRFDARGLRTGSGITAEYSTNPEGSQVTTTRYPPSGFDPGWRTRAIHFYDSEQRIVKVATEPTSFDETLVEKQTYDEDGFQLPSTRSGGATAPAAGAIRLSPEEFRGASPSQSWVELGQGVQRVLRAAAQISSEVTTDSFGRATRLVVPRLLAQGLPPEAGAGPWQIQYDKEDHVRFIHAEDPSSGNLLPLGEYRYDTVGNLVEALGPSGEVVRLSYDERDSLADRRGDLSRETENPGGPNERVTDYRYDGLRRLRSVIEYPHWPDPSDPVTTEFTYDTAGRRLAFRT